MKVFTVSTAIFSFFGIATAANACVRDKCFNAIASVATPAQASRRADCSAVLRTVVDDDTTITVTRTTAGPGPTSYVLPPQGGRRDLQGPDVAAPQITPFPEADEGGILVARDKIVVSGIKPAYATACSNLVAYGSACLCYGVKAVTYRV